MSWLDNIGQEPIEDSYIETLNVEDNDWHVDRLGKVTGSTFGKLVVQSRDKKSYVLSKGQTATKLIYKIAWERLLFQGNISNGLGRLNISSREMQHGNDYEGAAIQKFEEITGLNVVSEQKFYKHDDWIGGTPDGFIGEDGLIEIKSPYNGGNHIMGIVEQKIYNPEHLYQIQGYLWITGRKWCKYCTYDPDLIEELQLNIIHVERDEEMINGIAEVMECVKEKIREILENENFKK